MGKNSRVGGLLRLNSSFLGSSIDPASLIQLNCGGWAAWPHLMRLRYAVGLAHGMRWWMLWEWAGSRSRGAKSAWLQAADAISAVDIEKELSAYCAAHLTDNFLDALVETMWRVARDKGAPIRKR